MLYTRQGSVIIRFTRLFGRPVSRAMGLGPVPHPPLPAVEGPQRLPVPVWRAAAALWDGMEGHVGGPPSGYA